MQRADSMTQSINRRFCSPEVSSPCGENNDQWANYAVSTTLPDGLSPDFTDFKSTQSVSNSLHVLVVDEELPFPLNNGKRIRTFNLLKYLASVHNITFLCHRNGNREELNQGIERFRQVGIKTEFLERRAPMPSLLLPKSRLILQLGINLFSIQPYVVQRNISRELRSRVAEIAGQRSVDLVHFEWTPYAASMTKNVCKPWVTHAHNVESLIWKRYVQHEKNIFKRAFVRSQWKKMIRFERKVFKSSTSVIFVSETDSDIARIEFDCQRRAVVDNGVDVHDFPFTAPTFRDPNRILFLGSLDWRPNVDGLLFFLDEVWPQIQCKRPSILLDIVGRAPVSRLARRIRYESNVNLYYDVSSVQPFLSRAGCMVVPLRIGGGSRLKILEAASSGLPVISTPVGAEGLAMDAGKHFVRAESAAEFAESVIRSADNPASLKELAQAARKLVEEQ
jgi:glycosyltransferase involved in cell wall biosynthesis